MKMEILNNRKQENEHITEICKDIYRIQIPLNGSSLGTINSYVIRGADRSLLIDTGYRAEPCIETIRSSLSLLGVRPEKTDILLTHFHNDHSGAATDLIHPWRKIYVPAQEYQFFGIGDDPKVYTESRRPRYLKEGLSDEEFEKMMYITLPGSKGPDFFAGQFSPVDDRQTFAAGEYTLTAIHTPGHTPGHMCYWDEAHGLMFTGDHILFDISPNIIPWPGIPNILGLYLYSLQKLQNYPAAIALPGHRQPGSLSARIDEQIRHHKQRLNECESLVKLYPDKTALEITRLLSWKIRRPRGTRGIPLPLLRYAFGECLCHLDYLRFQKKIEQTFSGGFYRYR